MSKILIVDDKELMRDSVATTLTRKGHVVLTASSAAAAIDRLAKRQIDAVITDLQMPEMDGLQLLEEIRRIDEQLPVIVMTAYGSVDTAVNAMKQGASDYITKPFSGDELIVALDRVLEHQRILRENQILRASAPGGGLAGNDRHVMIGRGARMRDLGERLECIGRSHGTVLITGESGSGKEVAARRIHACSPRRDQPFLAINCAALSTSLLESELFGHEKGAFTGADKLRKGRFELADGGTLLLDEVSEIAPLIQAKLLRVLQEQMFDRVGSSRSQAVDVRVIATTNRDLPQEISRGNFRQDLFYRLNVLPVDMPALRQHVDDLDDLVAHFLGRVAAREGAAPKTFEPEAIEVLRRYSWPGNIRELQNICERAAVLTRGGTVGADLVRPWLAVPAAMPTRLAPGEHPMASATLEAKPSVMGIVCDGHVTLDDIERESIIATLGHFDGHRQKSARALGIGVRTLGLKLKKWKEQQLVSPSL